MSNQNSLVNRGELPTNTLIDHRYLIQKILGQGGLGRTYLAVDVHRFHEPCVLKEFAPFGSGQYDLEKSRNLFKREAQILHHITHPQIPKFLACFEVQGRLFLVQEYVNGKTYSALLEERQQNHQVFTELEIVQWLKNLLPVFHYIHQLGIIHRDISPDNIMQPQGGKLPVIIDFGVGKLTNLSAVEGTNTSFRKHSYVGKMSFVGKIGYAPREQISMGRCSPSSDLYALGVTALVLLTGKEPTTLVDQRSLEWQWHKYTQVSRKLATILSRMTEEKPLKRYQTASQVLQDLHQFYPDSSPKFEPNQLNNPKESLQSTTIYTSSETSPEPTSAISSEVESNQADNAPESLQSTTIVNSTPNSVTPTSLIQSPEDETIILNPEKSTSAEDDTMIITGVNSAPPSAPKPPTTNIQEPSSSSSVSNTKIVSFANSQPVNPSQSNRPPITKSFRPEFMRRCQQELALCIGPIASIVIQEVMTKKRPQSPEELIKGITEYISDEERAIAFSQRFSVN